MRRIALIIGLIVLFLLPITFYVIKNQEQIDGMFDVLRAKTKPSDSSLYSVQSQVSGVEISLINTQYLDYITSGMGLFENQAIVDPRIYRGFPDLPLRHTITHIQFVLVPTIDQFLVGVSGKNDFAARSDYVVEKETLIVRVAVNFSEMGDPLAKQHQFEDVFLRAALISLLYANDKPVGEAPALKFKRIQDDMKSYLYTEILPWPIEIKR
jgi:hypothetical protein